MSKYTRIPKYIYIHYPFCKRKCHYCDFPIYAVGKNQENLDSLSHFSQTYVSSLTKEISHVLNQIVHKRDTLNSIYFGGGTPSLIPSDHLKEIFTTIEKHYDTTNAEITLEFDPGTFGLAKLNLFSSLGMNRMSLGIQTLNDSTLKKLGRSHDSKDIWDAIETISHSQKFSDFSNVSFDLIIGLPNENLETFSKTLEEVLRIKPGHLSIYLLTLEKNTPFTEKYNFQEGLKPLPSVEELCEIYEYTSNTLVSHGYDHYEISSFSLGKDKRGKHNSNYWNGEEPYFGFGMGAASLFECTRFTRPRNLPKYFQWVADLEKNGLQKTILDQGDKELPGTLDWIKSILIGKSRTSDGFDLKFLVKNDENLLKKLKDFLEPYVFSNLIIEKSFYNEYKVIFTRPKGYLYSDEVISRLFLFLEQNVPFSA